MSIRVQSLHRMPHLRIVTITTSSIKRRLITWFLQGIEVEEPKMEWTTLGDKGIEEGFAGMKMFLQLIETRSLVLVNFEK